MRIYICDGCAENCPKTCCGYEVGYDELFENNSAYCYRTGQRDHSLTIQKTGHEPDDKFFIPIDGGNEFESIESAIEYNLFEDANYIRHDLTVVNGKILGWLDSNEYAKSIGLENSNMVRVWAKRNKFPKDCILRLGRSIYIKEGTARPTKAPTNKKGECELF